MFQSARIKITSWYLLIIMAVSVLFSLAFYRASTQEMQRIIDRIQFEQTQQNNRIRPFPPRRENIPTIEELQGLKSRFQTHLIIINGVILLFAGLAGYFLAGKTLRPIKLMVDEQTQFISDASHELRTPLANLRAEMEGCLLEPQINEKQARNLIASNLEELDRLQRLTNDLLKLTHLHLKADSLSERKVSLDNVLKEVFLNLAPKAKQKQIKINNQAEDLQLFGNHLHFVEIFNNLIDNAIKYSHKSTTITISTNSDKDNQRIIIADQGIGISKKDQPYIFDRLFRADRSRSEALGYGLGLAIVKKLVNAYQGNITCKSEENHGSVFTVLFPKIN